MTSRVVKAKKEMEDKFSFTFFEEEIIKIHESIQSCLTSKNIHCERTLFPAHSPMNMRIKEMKIYRTHWPLALDLVDFSKIIINCI